MHVIICLDDDGGFAFNHRRQSSDRILMAYLKKHYGPSLYVSLKGAALFDSEEGLKVCPDFPDQVPAGCWCYIDAEDPLPEADRVDHILVCRWNRRYPSDRKLDRTWLDERMPVSEQTLRGSSHEEITLRLYKKGEAGC